MNVEYYVIKQIIPTLSRLFLLLGCDPMNWIKNIPLKQANLYTARCLYCDCLLAFHTNDQQLLCKRCSSKKANVKTVAKYQSQLRMKELEIEECYEAFRACCGNRFAISRTLPFPCESLSCPIYLSRRRLKQLESEVIKFHLF